jgi:Holliday junction resolvasome RuvABC DNA-binding subunit
MGKPSIRMISRANNLIFAAKDIGYDIILPSRYNARYLQKVAIEVSYMTEIYNRSNDITR